MIAWTDVDGVEVDAHAVTLDLASAPAPLTLTHLARGLDRFVAELGNARARARRAALCQWTGDAPLDAYPCEWSGRPATVVLFPDGVVVEALTGVPAMAPFGLVSAVERDGWTATFRLRGGLDPVVVSKLARRADELVADVALARDAAAVRGDGWAVPVGEWRGDPVTSPEIDVLRGLAGDGLRVGLKGGPGDSVLPFVLAPVGGRVAVEGAGDEARATFVFATDDVDRLNAVLLLTSFRREALYFPDDALGRWATAVRLLPVVRWARSALVARIVHDASWADSVTRALQPR